MILIRYLSKTKENPTQQQNVKSSGKIKIKTHSLLERGIKIKFSFTMNKKNWIQCKRMTNIANVDSFYKIIKSKKINRHIISDNFKLLFTDQNLEKKADFIYRIIKTRRMVKRLGKFAPIIWILSCVIY